ncbi:MAG: hypoxanthine phosphoribosyltransferase [Dehalococcoidia bacterium]|nr:hypoxanthine phosphoribosyltransferase [Dehalococcoidia bacterium]
MRQRCRSIPTTSVSEPAGSREGPIGPILRGFAYSVPCPYAPTVRVLITAEEIASCVRELGARIADDYRDSPDLVLVGVLRGSFCFLADLARAIHVPLRVDCIGLASYAGDRAGAVRITSDLVENIEGADVIVVEDIIERGSTLGAALELLAARQPASLAVCSILRKDVPREHDIDARYVGFEIADEFVVGYGLDYAQRFRNLPYIGIPGPEDLAAHPG